MNLSHYALIAALVVAAFFKWQAMSCDTDLVKAQADLSTQNSAIENDATKGEVKVAKSEVAARKVQTEYAKKRVQGSGPDAMNKFFEGL